MRSSVVLPQPDGPSSETNSPLLMVRAISSSTLVCRKRLATPSIRKWPEPGSGTAILLSPSPCSAHDLVPLLDPRLPVLVDVAPVRNERFARGGEAGRDFRCGIG